MNRTNNNAEASTKTRPRDEVLTRFSKNICTLMLFALRRFPALWGAGKSCMNERGFQFSGAFNKEEGRLLLF